MRPNQQNKNRSRGRNNNGGRKHVNPLSRSFESNGPDVKVRGNAAHVAEKYLQLARDAQSSGDSVMAENYLQHAEHYFRIVAAAQPQQGVQRSDQPNQASEDADDDFPPINDRFASPEPANRGGQQQSDQQQQGQAQAQPAAQSQPQENAAADDQQVATPANDETPAESEPRRQRRPRRRTRSAEGDVGEASGDAQPEVDLPAFLTAGNTTAAE